MMPESLQDLNFQHLFYFWSVARDGTISAACEQLGLTQPTISMQLRKLEQTLGHQLFKRNGRKLEMTEMGQMVFEYCEDMFSAGRELVGALRGARDSRAARLHVGVANAMPKLITYRLIEPVLQLPDHCQVICLEDELDDLVLQLPRHRYDVILSDRPIAAPSGVRSFNHPLGECGTAICAVASVASRYRRSFPASLDGAPFFLPTPDADLRRALDRWFDSQNFTPRILGAFDDSALLKEFGHGGAGLFPVPAAVLPEVKRQYGVELVGHLPTVLNRFFAITTERKLKHPAVVAISHAAREGFLATGTA